MKRILTVLIGLILMVGLFVIPVSAESAASRIDTRMTVTSDGDCRVTMTVTAAGVFRFGSYLSSAAECPGYYAEQFHGQLYKDVLGYGSGHQPHYLRRGGRDVPGV